ncbi:stalk domain-containing protein [Gorillibacterium sp. sgz5001074]|uniref:stalk domain-containing protein n=1 Tax=Gorillibacterium sp. sgz5001074 TaxID=3446695 RepID=UPI003F677189
MKTKGIILTVLLFSALTTTANAMYERVIQAKVSHAKLFVNDQEVRFKDEEAPLLSYNDRVYVPLRQYSNALHLPVGYDDAKETITVNNNVNYLGKSQAHETVSNDHFKLTIHTAKTEYMEGEPVRIWSRLVNEQDKAITIRHGEPILGLSIKDEAGYESNQIYALVSARTVFEPGDEYAATLGTWNIIQYNSYKIGQYDIITYEKTMPSPGSLPKGKYIISSHANYRLDGEKEDYHLKATVEITVQ